MSILKFLPTDSNIIAVAKYFHLYSNGMSNEQLAHRIVFALVLVAVIGFIIFAVIGSISIYYLNNRRFKKYCIANCLDYKTEKIKSRNRNKDDRYNKYYKSSRKHIDIDI